MQTNTFPAHDTTQINTFPTHDTIQTNTFPTYDTIQTNTISAHDTIHTNTFPAHDVIHTNSFPAHDMIHTNSFPAHDIIPNDTIQNIIRESNTFPAHDTIQNITRETHTFQYNPSPHQVPMQRIHDTMHNISVKNPVNRQSRLFPPQFLPSHFRCISGVDFTYHNHLYQSIDNWIVTLFPLLQLLVFIYPPVSNFNQYFTLLSIFPHEHMFFNIYSMSSCQKHNLFSDCFPQRIFSLSAYISNSGIPHLLFLHPSFRYVCIKKKTVKFILNPFFYSTNK